jgi:hypothetical protein
MTTYTLPTFADGSLPDWYTFADGADDICVPCMRKLLAAGELEPDTVALIDYTSIAHSACIDQDVVCCECGRVIVEGPEDEEEEDEEEDA